MEGQDVEISKIYKAITERVMGEKKRGTKQQHVRKLMGGEGGTCTEGGHRVHEDLPPLPHVPKNRIC